MQGNRQQIAEPKGAQRSRSIDGIGCASDPDKRSADDDGLIPDMTLI
jgi:hypothetical protein